MSDLILCSSVELRATQDIDSLFSVNSKEPAVGKQSSQILSDCNVSCSCSAILGYSLLLEWNAFWGDPFAWGEDREC
jgi:hypothetical protein